MFQNSSHDHNDTQIRIFKKYDLNACKVGEFSY